MIFINDEVKTSISNAESYVATPSDIKYIVDISKNYETDDFKLALIRFPEKTDGEITMRFFDSKKNMKQVILEPKTFNVIKFENGNTFEKFILKLHHTLLFKDGGEVFVGFIGFILCIICISGVIIWFPKIPINISQVKNISIPKFSLHGRALNINLHKSFGIWMAIFLLVVGFTGTFLVFSKEFQSAVSHFSMVRDFKKTAVEYQLNNGQLKGVDIELIAKNVILSVSEISEIHTILAVHFPQTNDPYRFTIRPNNYKTGGHGISVFVMQNGTILEIRDPINYSKGEKFLMWLGMLHKGSGMGVIWRCLQVIFGSSILLFAYTGLMIWWKKPKKLA